MQSDNIVNVYSTTIVSIFQDVVKNYESAKDTIVKMEQELNDIYHEAEFSDPKSACDGYNIYKEIRELRLKRREAKEQVELLQDMYDLVKSQQGANFKIAVQRVQGNSVKIKDAQDNRTYTPRQRSDLTITDKTCTANKPFEQMLKEFKETKITFVGGKARK